MEIILAILAILLIAAIWKIFQLLKKIENIKDDLRIFAKDAASYDFYKNYYLPKMEEQAKLYANDKTTPMSTPMAVPSNFTQFSIDEIWIVYSDGKLYSNRKAEIIANYKSYNIDINI